MHKEARERSICENIARPIKFIKDNPVKTFALVESESVLIAGEIGAVLFARHLGPYYFYGSIIPVALVTVFGAVSIYKIVDSTFSKPNKQPKSNF